MNRRLQSTQNLLRTCFFIVKSPQNQSFATLTKKDHRRLLNFISAESTKLSLPRALQPAKNKSSSVVRPSAAVSGLKRSQLSEGLMEMPKEAHVANVGEANGWLTIGQYSVFAWSVSGVESCVVIKSEDMNLVFDMGVAVPESVKSINVFITHGHVDHIGAVANHVAKRSLFGMKPAYYFVPPHLAESLKVVTKAHYDMAETVDALGNVNVIPFTEGDTAKINRKFFVKSFPTVHRIPSQGYIVYKEEKTLKEEYRGMEGFEVAALHREGKNIHDITITPEIAYTGDTTFDVFANPPTPDLLKVKLLITETTFLDNELGSNMLQKARDRGHTHLLEIAENAHLFADVGHIVLVHFSNKYSAKYITDCLRDKLPAELKSKVTPATVAKATNVMSYS